MAKKLAEPPPPPETLADLCRCLAPFEVVLSEIECNEIYSRLKYGVYEHKGKTFKVNGKTFPWNEFSRGSRVLSGKPPYQAGRLLEKALRRFKKARLAAVQHG